MLAAVKLAVLAAVTVHAVPLAPRAVIDHDAVVGFPQTVPNSVLGQNYLRFQPYLKVVNGCVPFPAVDAEGNTRCVLSLAVETSLRTTSNGMRADSATP